MKLFDASKDDGTVQEKSRIRQLRRDKEISAFEQLRKKGYFIQYDYFRDEIHASVPPKLVKTSVNGDIVLVLQLHRRFPFYPPSLTFSTKVKILKWYINKW